MSQEKVITRLLRRDFYAFACKAIRFCNGRELPLDDVYLKIIFVYLLAVASGEITRLIVNMPPRHLKTMAGIALACWMLGHDPSKKLMIVSYGEDLAKLITGHIRKIMKSAWYRELFPGTRIGDTDTGTLVTTTAGGHVTAVSFTGSITGQGADLIIVDDPHKITDAASPEQIEKTIETFNSTVESRLDDPQKGQILVLAHRIARNDLSGALIDQGGWDHLRLPIIAEEDLEFELGDMAWTMPKGSILRRKAFTLEKIEAYRKKTKTPGFRTLYLQDPTELDEPILPEDFTTYKKLPPLIGGTLISVDWAQSENPLSSFSVIQVWRAADGKFCLTDQWRARVPYDVLAAKLRSMVTRYRAGIVLIESGGPADALALELRRMGSSAPMIEIVPTGGKGKQERFEVVKPHIKLGLVSLPHSAEWVPEYVDELTSFPDAENDDQVDATVQALKWLAAGRPIPPAPPRCMGKLFNARTATLRQGPWGPGSGGRTFVRNR